jgi:hypothetical protein
LDKHTNFLSEVTLRVPPPLNKALSLDIQDQKLSLFDGEQLIANCKAGTINLEIPAPPTFEEAENASKSYLGFQGHNAFPTCFVCGPKRAKGDGLNIFAGKHKNTSIYAAPWVPDGSLADSDGNINNEFIWASLDCPGAYSIMGPSPMTVVLGRMTTHIEKPIKANEKCVVIGWPTGSEGKKHFCGTALFNEALELCAFSKAIWFDIGEKQLKN